MEFGQDYIISIFEDFVMPGVAGGFIIFFSIYLLSLGVSLAYRLLKN